MKILWCVYYVTQRQWDVETRSLASRFGVLAGPEMNQSHLFSEWPPAGTDDVRKVALLHQLQHLDASYPGGLEAYIASARKLLSAAERGENPLDHWTPSVPEDGFDLAPGTPAYREYELLGIDLAEAGALAFVVPAGGLGERLGFQGVKFALPSESSTGMSVLAVYCGYIQALEQLANAKCRGTDEAPSRITLPLAIMVSDDTDTGIRELLEASDYFGLTRAQVTILKQEKVAALRDAEGAFAMADDFTIATKPHGHGDVHFLLHSSGTAQRWLDQGVRYMHFFQDTNTLYFSNFLATLGVSAKHGLAVGVGCFSNPVICMPSGRHSQ